MSAWRTGGIGPEKANAGLRGIAFFAIVIAFLAVSNDYVSKGDDEPKPTAPASSRVVDAPTALSTVLPAAQAAKYTFGTSATQRAAIIAGGRTDVFITDVPADASALQTGGHCSDPVTIATKGDERIVACVVTRTGDDTGAGIAYVQSLATLKARSAFLDAGYDVPTAR